MLKKTAVSVFILFFSTLLTAQVVVKGIVVDSASHQPLAFATVRLSSINKAMITGINGRFEFNAPDTSGQLTISYTGYRTRRVAIDSFTTNDSIYIAAANITLDEVVVRSDFDKIRYIVNSAIRNKPKHNPEQYDLYSCYIYYKMKVDLVPQKNAKADTALARRERRIEKANAKKNKELPTLPKPDTSVNILKGNNHIIFSETYSKRVYKKPQQVYEEVVASRFSGLKETWFANLITDVLPFHVYTDYISLNETDYINPVAKGWEQRYRFRIIDEVATGNDTTYVLSFEPKDGASFNSLEGTVFINTNGYAISHFIGTTGSSNPDRSIRLEQIYQFNNDRWFPRELNYDVQFNAYPAPYLGLKLNGHSVIDSISFTKSAIRKLNKAKPVTIGDSVDRYTEQQWERFRPESITVREANTYRVIDSLSDKKNINGFVNVFGKLAVGKLPLGFIDIDIPRLLAFNDYEDTRLGIGITTNNKLSRYFSVGGWMGYGFRDKVMKYGYNATVYPKGDKDTWLQFLYQSNYLSAGLVSIHPDFDRTGYRNWILSRVEQVEDYQLAAHTQAGYWQFDVNALSRKTQSRYLNLFETKGNNITRFAIREAGFGVRYAYAEKRIPIFDYYLPSPGKYPVFYLKGSTGTITGDNYRASYLRSLAAITFKKHISRWGNDQYHIEAGIIRTADNQPLPPAALLAGNGYRTEGTNFYVPSGFVTMYPYQYFADRYVSFIYKHDFDWQLWNTSFSQPFISVAHGLTFGGLSTVNKIANSNLIAASNGYHESGLILNQLLKFNFVKLAHLYVHAGAFYHWSPTFDWQKNGVFVLGFGTGF